MPAGCRDGVMNMRSVCMERSNVNQVSAMFRGSGLDKNKLSKLDVLPEPRSRYLIAMTPRSGSSFLCDMMTKSRRFGAPGEALNEAFIPKILKSVPGRSPDEYLRNFCRAKKTPNGVAGLKTSWFQFRNFKAAMEDEAYLSGFRYIYLFRRDIAAQAVSLYKATASQVFHTNIAHSEHALAKLAALKYDYAAIDMWRNHIAEQERGWQQYFHARRIFPLCLSYEDMGPDVLGTMQRIATFVGVDPKNVARPDSPSVFEKIGDAQNLEWARRYEQEALARAGGPRPDNDKVHASDTSGVLQGRP